MKKFGTRPVFWREVLFLGGEPQEIVSNCSLSFVLMCTYNLMSGKLENCNMRLVKVIG